MRVQRTQFEEVFLFIREGAIGFDAEFC